MTSSPPPCPFYASAPTCDEYPRCPVRYCSKRPPTTSKLVEALRDQDIYERAGPYGDEVREDA